MIIDDKGVPRVGDKDGWIITEKLTPEKLARMKKDAIESGLTEEEYQRREDLMKVNENDEESKEKEAEKTRRLWEGAAHE